MARDLYRDESWGVDLSETVYAFDSTTIDLCLSLGKPQNKFYFSPTLLLGKIV